MEDEAPDPPFVFCRHLNKVHFIAYEWFQPSDFGSNGVERHMQQKASQHHPDERFQFGQFARRATAKPKQAKKIQNKGQ